MATLSDPDEHQTLDSRADPTAEDPSQEVTGDRADELVAEVYADRGSRNAYLEAVHAECRSDR